MSRPFEVNSATAGSPFEIEWRRLALVIGLGLAAVALLVPLTTALGLGARKSSVTVLRFAVLIGFAVTAGRRLKDETALFRCSGPLLVWARGFLVGAATLGAWVVILTLVGERSFEGMAPGKAVLYGAKYLPLAFLIGFLEDLLFFGFLFAALGRRSLGAALVYALAHFLAPARDANFEAGSLVGLETIAAMGRSLAEGLGRPIEVLGLVLVGWVLVSLRRESGSLWIAMGVHGGWYWVRQVSRKLGEDIPGRREWLFGSDRFYDGLLGWVAIVVTGVILMRAMQRRRWLRGEEEG